MRFHDYQKEVLRTESPTLAVMHMAGTTHRLLHACLGINSEIAEIIQDRDNKPNVVQEIGDAFWYIGIGCDSLDIDMENLDTDYECDDAYDDLIIQSGILTNQVKRMIYYGTERDDELILKVLGSIVACLRWLAVENNVTIETCLEKNVAKLRTRYPEGFTPEKAVYRSVRKEERHFNDL